MQTFLPLPDFAQSAACLDMRRLGKQRVEAKQILLCLEGGRKTGWKNHPAVLMWEGYEGALTQYGVAVCTEWIERGYKDSLKPFFEERMAPFVLVDLPPWWNSDAFHASHRSNLLRKDPEHYGQFQWSESPDLPYVWPVQKEKV